MLGTGNGADVQTGLEVTGSAIAYGFGVTDNGLSQVPPQTFPSILGHANDVAFHTGVLGYVSSGRRSPPPSAVSTTRQAPTVICVTRRATG